MQAVIFDMDGVLVDTEPIHDKFMVFFLKKLGINISQGYFHKFRGRTARSIWTHLSNKYGLSTPVDELIYNVRISYLKYLDSLDTIKPTDGIVVLLRLLKKNNIALAVASSAYNKRIQMLLNKCNLIAFFPVIVAGDDVAHDKPHPEVYLKTAELLKIQPKDCVVFEDAISGVLSAKSAGMKIVGYKDPNNKQDLSKSDLVIRSFCDITIAKLREL